jgi:hypothetical protein
LPDLVMSMTMLPLAGVVACVIILARLRLTPGD